MTISSQLVIGVGVKYRFNVRLPFHGSWRNIYTRTLERRRLNDIVVIGAGCIGQSLTASLLKSNQRNRVFLAVNTLAQSNAIGKSGITIRGAVEENFVPSKRLIVSDRLFSEFAEHNLSPKPIIFLATKANSAVASLYPFKSLFSQIAPTIVCLQNGLGVEHEVRKDLKALDVPVLKGHIFGAVHKKDDTIFAYRGRIMVERVNECFSRRLHSAFTKQPKTIFDLEISMNILQSIYPKIAVNCVCNPLTIILNQNLGSIRMHYELLIRRICNEIYAVAYAQGFDLQSNEHLADSVLETMSQFSSHYSSMYLDHVAGQKTEIEYINGAISLIAEGKGIKAPLNQALTIAIKEIENLRRGCGSVQEFYQNNSFYLSNLINHLSAL